MYFTGFSLEVTLLEGILDFALGVPSEFGSGQTRGLLGVFNGDPSDDLTNANGTILPIDSSEEDIFTDFGQTCELKPLMLQIPCVTVTLSGVFRFEEPIWATVMDNTDILCGYVTIYIY